MPFWKKEKKKEEATNGDNKEKVNYKARLEHKQYLAQESPEPVYDISECGLKNVPSGVYTKCKVLRKEALLIQNNDLTSLSGGGVLSDMGSILQVLDLHGNHLEKLPDEIGTLKELKVLYVHNNRLKKLPDTIGDLRKLQNLDLSSNQLKELPQSIAKLPRLRQLNVCSNPKMVRLPKALCQVRSLELVTLDAAKYQFPSAEVCQKGTEDIMKFLCKECDIEHIPPSAYEAPTDPDEKKNGDFVEDPYEKIVRGSLKILERQKEEKLKEMQAMEVARKEEEVREAALAASAQDNKKKLMADLAEQEARNEEAVKRLQQLKDKERENLFNSLSSTENQTDALIQVLMASNARNSDPQRVLEELEKERKEMEERFTIKTGEAEKLREQEVLKEMQRAFAEDMRREQLRRVYEEDKLDIVNHALSTDLENDRAVDAVLQSKGKQQSELISGLLEDEKYQREAFSSLFLKQDQRHIEITSQVEQIQNELANLTMIEMTKKDLKVEFEVTVMDEKRETLTKMLLQLMEQKQQRADELQNRLQEMEDHRSSETENYWLIQYQKLMDAKPKAMVDAESNIEPELKELLAKAGAEEYIPIFAMRKVSLKQLSYMRDQELFELGLHNTYMRQKILVCAEEYASMQDRLASKLSGIESNGQSNGNGVPSAPPAEAKSIDNNGENGASAQNTEPSAPPQPVDTFKSTECVVCMEAKCDIIFLPCGHVCCCHNCEKDVNACPLCRASIAQKVRLY